MRVVIVICLVVVVLSIIRDHTHFAPRPSGALPAVNVP
jgi:hypothetical protein